MVVDLAVTCAQRFVVERVVVDETLAAIARQGPQVEVVGGLRAERQRPVQWDANENFLIEAAFAEFREWYIGECCERADFNSGRKTARDFESRTIVPGLLYFLLCSRVHQCEQSREQRLRSRRASPNV